MPETLTDYIAHNDIEEGLLAKAISKAGIDAKKYRAEPKYDGAILKALKGLKTAKPTKVSENPKKELKKPLSNVKKASTTEEVEEFETKPNPKENRAKNQLVDEMEKANKLNTLFGENPTYSEDKIKSLKK